MRGRHVLRYSRLLLLVGLSARAAGPAATVHREISPLNATLESLATADGLSLAEVGERAAQVSPDVEAGKAEELAADARLDRATLGYFPRLDVLLRLAALSTLPAQNFGTAVVAPQAAVGPLPAGTPLVNAPVSVTLPNSQRLGQALVTYPFSDVLLAQIPKVDGARRLERASEEDVAAARRRAAYGAQQVALAKLRALLAEQVAARALSLAQTQQEDASRSESLGAANRADVLRAQARVAQAQQTLAQTAHLKALLDSRLGLLLRADGDLPVRLHEDLRRSLPPLPATPVEALLSEAWAKRPEVKALRARREAEERFASGAWGGVWPKLQAFAEATTGDPNPRYLVPPGGLQTTWSVGLELRFTPNEAFGSAADARAAEARASAFRAQERALKEALQADLAEAWARIQDADSAASSSARELESAEAALNVRNRLFAAGKATPLELLEARNLLTDAESALANARVDQRLARLALAYTRGEPLVP